MEPLEEAASSLNDFANPLFGGPEEIAESITIAPWVLEARSSQPSGGANLQTVAGQTGSATTPLGFAGQYTMGQSGLIYLRARFYDSATAQFLTRDPLEARTRQPYAYALNNPQNVLIRQASVVSTRLNPSSKVSIQRRKKTASSKARQN